MSDSFVPTEWLTAADHLGSLAAVARDYVEAHDGWIPGSIAAAEMEEEDHYQGIPATHPVGNTLILPMVSLALAADHMSALAAVVKAERTAMAILTLIRPSLVALGMASYVADPSIDGRERMRRALNIELESALEQMYLVGEDSPRFGELADRRRSIAAQARTHWSHVSTPEPKKTALKAALPWHIGAKPPGDMGWIRQALAFLDAPSRMADSMYRIVSATTHAQPHAIHAFITNGSRRENPDGFVTVLLEMSYEDLILWLLAPTSALWDALKRCCQLFSWDLAAWHRVGDPILVEWNEVLERAKRGRITANTGLWLPPV